MLKSFKKWFPTYSVYISILFKKGAQLSPRDHTTHHVSRNSWKLWMFCEITDKKIDSVMPICFKLLSSRMSDGQKLLQIVVLQGRLTWACYQQISNFSRPVLSFDLLTDRLMPSITDRLLIMYRIFLSYINCVQLTVEFCIWPAWTSFC